MRRLHIPMLFLLGISFLIVPSVWAQSDGDIKQAIIQESIANYAGNCPCPYNTDRAGRRCGKRSAYSRPGGRSPICYPEDVTQDMIKSYRQKHGLPLE